MAEGRKPPEISIITPPADFVNSKTAQNFRRKNPEICAKLTKMIFSILYKKTNLFPLSFGYYFFQNNLKKY
nr:MAG TPA: hypothetical protein [Caudoviricetes sp.]